MPPEDIAYKATAPYSEEIAKQIVPVPKPPIGIGFEYFNVFKNFIITGGTYSSSTTYVVPKNKVLYITNVSMSLYMDNWTAGMQGNGYARITTNDVITDVGFLYVRGGRSGASSQDSAENIILNFPVPLRIGPNSTITFLGSKSSNDANSILASFFIIHGYLLKN